MIKEEFVCPNENCSRYNQYIAKYGSFKLIWVTGKGLVPENSKCPECGADLIKKEVEIDGNIGVNFGRFASADNETKKRMILERNKKVAKQDKELKEYYRNKQLNKMTQ